MDWDSNKKAIGIKGVIPIALAIGLGGFFYFWSSGGIPARYYSYWIYYMSGCVWLIGVLDNITKHSHAAGQWQNWELVYSNSSEKHLVGEIYKLKDGWTTLK